METSKTKKSALGTVFPSEKKIISDPVTGARLIFLTSRSGMGDSKIYHTHNQWTSDLKWLVFRSNRVPGEAMAVNEETGDIVQVTEGGFRGMLLVARKSMKLYFMGADPSCETALFETDLGSLFDDALEGTVKEASRYQRQIGMIPAAMEAKGDMTLDADEEVIHFRVGREEAARHLKTGTKIEPDFGPRSMGRGPGGIASFDMRTGRIETVVATPFQIGHIQANPWVAGEIVFCWETGGKAPQRTWIVRAGEGSYRPLYPEASYEWITHEAIIGKDETALAVLGHRPISETGLIGAGHSIAGMPEIGNSVGPGQEPDWGYCGTREKPTGLAIVNMRTREMYIPAQIGSGSGFWHVHGSSDGRWAVGDDFARNLYLVDRRTGEMKLLTAGHKETAEDHPHPTFSPDGKRIMIQSAMLSDDGRSMNICVIPLEASCVIDELRAYSVSDGDGYGSRGGNRRSKGDNGAVSWPTGSIARSVST